MRVFKIIFFIVSASVLAACSHIASDPLVSAKTTIEAAGLLFDHQDRLAAQRSLDLLSDSELQAIAASGSYGEFVFLMRFRPGTLDYLKQRNDAHPLEMSGAALTHVRYGEGWFGSGVAYCTGLTVVDPGVDTPAIAECLDIRRDYPRLYGTHVFPQELTGAILASLDALEKLPPKPQHLSDLINMTSHWFRYGYVDRVRYEGIVRRAAQEILKQDPAFVNAYISLLGVAKDCAEVEEIRALAKKNWAAPVAYMDDFLRRPTKSLGYDLDCPRQ